MIKNIILGLLLVLSIGCLFVLSKIHKLNDVNINDDRSDEIDKTKCGKNNIELFGDVDDDEDEDEDDDDGSDDSSYSDEVNKDQHQKNVPFCQKQFDRSSYARTDHTGPYSIVDKLYNKQSGTNLGPELGMKGPEHLKYDDGYYTDEVNYCSSHSSEEEENDDDDDEIENHRLATTKFKDNITENTRDTMQPYQVETFRSDENNFTGKTAKDVYDGLTKYNRGEKLCVRRPNHDKISNDKYYVSNASNGNYISSENWSYNKEKIMNGGPFGDVYGNDVSEVLYPTV